MNATSLDLQSMRERMSVPRTAVTTTAAKQSAPPEMGTDEEECLAFGYLRGIRDRALSLELRFANGDSKAFPYSWLGPMQYNPSAGLLLTFVGDRVYLVLLEGSNLNALVNESVSLYDRGIQRHRVTWVREMTRQQAGRAGQGEVTVERIQMHSHRPDEEPKGVAWLEAFKARPEPGA
jgi:hypothetical protein